MGTEVILKVMMDRILNKYSLRCGGAEEIYSKQKEIVYDSAEYTGMIFEKRTAVKFWPIEKARDALVPYTDLSV